MAKKNQAPATKQAAQPNKRPGICQYCGKPEAFDGPFCSKECKKAYEEGMKHDQPRVKLYSIGMIAGILILIYGGIMNVSEAMGVGAIIIEAYEEGMKHDQPRVKLYSIGMIAGILILIYGGIMNVSEAMGVGAIIIGMTFLFMPFLPTGTVKSMGYRRSRMLGRVAGVIMLVMGIWAGWFY